MLGVSLSASADAIDCAQLRAGGVGFSVVRASIGASSCPDFADKWNALREAGLRRCAAHVFRSDQDAIAQAVRFLKVELQRGDLPPALEIDEVDSKPTPLVVDALHEWLAVVQGELEARHGTLLHPMIRTSERVWRLLGQPAVFEPYPLWIVDRSRFHDPRCPAPWGAKQWTFHQYTLQTAGVPGVRYADLDRFNVLGVGDRGIRVVTLKHSLAACGYDSSSTDEFDERTRRLVLHFQAARGLVQDGLVDVHTFAELQWP